MIGVRISRIPLFVASDPATTVQVGLERAKLAVPKGETSGRILLIYKLMNRK